MTERGVVEEFPCLGKGVGFEREVLYRVPVEATLPLPCDSLRVVEGLSDSQRCSTTEAGGRVAFNSAVLHRGCSSESQG